jgi:hypothetical protein
MTNWSEEDKAQIRSWLQRGIGRKFIEHIKSTHPEIVATTTDQYALLAAEKEGRMKLIHYIENWMSTPIENIGAFAQHVDMSKD